MGQVLHRSATTTEAIRRAIQHSQESLRSLARRHGINPKTVAKWKNRESTADRRTGPTVPKSTVLTVEQEAIIADLIPPGETLIRRAQSSEEVRLNVDSVSYWIATNNARDNLLTREAFARYGSPRAFGNSLLLTHFNRIAKKIQCRA